MDSHWKKSSLVLGSGGIKTSTAETRDTNNQSQHIININDGRDDGDSVGSDETITLKTCISDLLLEPLQRS